MTYQNYRFGRVSLTIANFQLVNEEDRPRIVQTVEQLQQRWRSLLDKAPPHLMRLEFRLDEAVFQHCIKDIEKEIVYEEQVGNLFLNQKLILF